MLTRNLREPIGENLVQVCTTTPCMLSGGNEILEAALNHLGGIHPGDTTKDKKFTVLEVECLGACSNAPMMSVGDDFYVCESLGSATHFVDCPTYRRILRRSLLERYWMLSQRGRHRKRDLRVAVKRVRTRQV
jgi:hypothetical protein